MPLDHVAGTSESVSATHSAFGDALAFADRVHARSAMREYRTLASVRMFVAALGLLVREARRDPQAANAEAKRAGIRASRLEVRIVRLVAGPRRGKSAPVKHYLSRPYRHGDAQGYGAQDQTARWANAASYLAQPPNGDVPPETWRDAVRYLNHRGGVRRLSNLYARRGSIEQPEPIRPTTIAAWGHYDSTDDNSTSEWFTPPNVFDALECTFDLDPASPGGKVVPWIPATSHFTMHEDGLELPWTGKFVWLNPPYGRHELYKWTEKFSEHRNGILLVPERTSVSWYQNLVADGADLILMLRDRIKFVNPNGDRLGQFPIGTHLIAIGEQGVQGLLNAHRAGLGMLLKPYKP